MAGKPYDPLDGVTKSTKKDELMERLRKAAALLRRQENADKARLAAVEARIRAKGAVQTENLKQAIISSTDQEWDDLVKFLEEFDDLLPIAAQRIVVGGRILLGQMPVEDDPEPTV